jgi:hypothetical protein
MDDIYTSVRVSNFRFRSRVTPFDWRLLHGVDADELVSKRSSCCSQAMLLAAYPPGLH